MERFFDGGAVRSFYEANDVVERDVIALILRIFYLAAIVSLRWEHLRFGFLLEGEPVQFREFDQLRALVFHKLFSLPPNPQLFFDDLLRAQHLVLQLNVFDPVFGGATHI